MSLKIIHAGAFFVINYPDTRKFNGLKLRILTIKFVLINEGELNRKKKAKKKLHTLI